MREVGSAESFRFLGVRGWSLYARLWRASSPDFRGTVFGCHGYTEHSGRYGDFARYLNGQGFHFTTFDLPGHGLSDGRKANIDAFSDYVECLLAFFDQIEKLALKPPYFLFGHSLGGLIGLRFLQTSLAARKVEKAFVTCPLLGLSTHSFHGVGVVVQNRWTARILEEICNWLPNIYLPNKKDLGGSVLTHDERIAALRKEDPLIDPKVTIHWTREFLRGIRCAFDDVQKIHTPLAIFQSGDDRVVSPTAPKVFFDQLLVKQKLFKVYPEMWHELLNETNRDQVREDIFLWLSGSSRGST